MESVYRIYTFMPNINTFMPIFKTFMPVFNTSMPVFNTFMLKEVLKWSESVNELLDDETDENDWYPGKQYDGY